VLALSAEGYSWRKVVPRDVAAMLAWPGSRKLFARNWRTGIREMAGSLSKRTYLGLVRRYVPSLELGDLERAPAGVRAQAVSRSGDLLDDFAISRTGHVLLVRNAPSPAATSSLAIAEHVAPLAMEVID
jgi:L-2-hydroxyglutarate oxidase LhgO